MPALLNIEIPVYQLAIFQRKSWKVTGPCCQICCIGAHTRTRRPLHYHQTVNRKPTKTMNWLKIVRSQYPHWNILRYGIHEFAEWHKWIWKVGMKSGYDPTWLPVAPKMAASCDAIFFGINSSNLFFIWLWIIRMYLNVMIDCWIAWR